MSLDSTPPRIFIYESELEHISRHVMDETEIETGGDFFGLWTKEGYPVIHFITGPGRNIDQTATHFNQDVEYLKVCGYLLNSKHGIEHIGAWHSHHRMKLSEPSPGDVHTMRNALRGTGFSRFIISICNIDENDEVAVNGYMFNRDNLNTYALCNWNILDGVSPVRERISRMEEAPFIEPETEAGEVAYYVKNTEAPLVGVNTDITGKPHFPHHSFWSKAEGKRYLKDVYEKMSSREDLANVEMVQLPDQRVAISFVHNDTKYELRFPHDFPKRQADVVEKVGMRDLIRVFMTGRRKKSRIQKFLESINVFDKA